MHAAQAMYDLVNDIESYPQFLPWCAGAKILQCDAHTMLAEVRIAYRGLSKSFTTRNQLEPHHKISMTLVDGPFSELSGVWTFSPLRENACKICLSMQFDFANAWVGHAVGPVFKQIADSMVDSFVRRAAQLEAGEK